MKHAKFSTCCSRSNLSVVVVIAWLPGRLGFPLGGQKHVEGDFRSTSVNRSKNSNWHSCFAVYNVTSVGSFALRCNYQMEPSQQELFRVVVQYVHEGKYADLIVALLIVYLPFVPAFWKGWQNRKEVRTLYKERLADKDREIERLAVRIKELENASLRTRRK